MHSGCSVKLKLGICKAHLQDSSHQDTRGERQVAAHEHYRILCLPSTQHLSETFWPFLRVGWGIKPFSVALSLDLHKEKKICIDAKYTHLRHQQIWLEAGAGTCWDRNALLLVCSFCEFVEIWEQPSSSNALYLPWDCPSCNKYLGFGRNYKVGLFKEKKKFSPEDQVSFPISTKLGFHPLGTKYNAHDPKQKK